jgi:hypothetical protein
MRFNPMTKRFAVDVGIGIDDAVFGDLCRSRARS